MKHTYSMLIVAFAFLTQTVFAETIADDALIGKSTHWQATYFTVKPDLRKCISPMCGGWIINPVNKRKMQCLDGRVMEECYVGTLNITIPHISEKQTETLINAMHQSQALISATITDDVPFGHLNVDRAWVSATDQAPSGRFLNVTDNGIRCITYPCPSYDGLLLNHHRVKSLASVDLQRVSATEEQLEQAFQSLTSEQGLQVAGRFVKISGPGGVAQGIEASQFYLELVGDLVEPQFCRPTGCSGQICAGEDVMTTCEWKPEYECYQSAVCSNAPNGECGWVMDDALRQCLARVKMNSILDF